MEKILHRIYGNNVMSGFCGSYFVPSDASAVPNWEIKGVSDCDTYIKRLGLTAGDENENKSEYYTMATRGDAEKSKDVTVIVPLYKDFWGNLWTILQEEARPIDIVRRGKNARTLAFPAGVIGDEDSFKEETPEESAARELKEETGLIAQEIKRLNKIPLLTTPGLTDESVYFYKATLKDIKPCCKAVTDGGTTRGWHFIKFKNLTKWLEEMEKYDKIPTCQTLSAIYLIENN